MARQRFVITADAVATAARSLGLKWHRPTVTAIEAGRRALSVPEFVLLPEILDRAHEQTYGDRIGLRSPTLASFLGAGQLGLTKTYSVPPEWVASVLKGDDPVMLGLESTPYDALATHAAIDQDIALEHAASRVPAAMRELLPRALVLAAGASEGIAARSLGVEPVQIAVAALHLWERGIAEEREKRLAEVGGEHGRGARSQMTRRLMKELAPVVAGFPKGDK